MVAFQHMIFKNRGQQVSQTCGIVFHIQQDSTTKSKINTQLSDYYLEIGSQNTTIMMVLSESSIPISLGDRIRTDANNAIYQSEQPTTDNVQRVYHPTLMTESERCFSNADRCGLGLGTRSREREHHRS